MVAVFCYKNFTVIVKTNYMFNFVFSYISLNFVDKFYNKVWCRIFQNSQILVSEKYQVAPLIYLIFSKIKKYSHNKKLYQIDWECQSSKYRRNNPINWYSNIHFNILDYSNFKYFQLRDFEGATKSYFTHYSCVVIVSFDTALCKSAFSTVSFGKLVFRLSLLSLNQNIKICIIMLFNFNM